MKNNRLKLTDLAKQALDENNMDNIYGGSDSPLCGNTCDCTCSCDAGNTSQSNSNVSSVSTTNHDTSFLSLTIDGLLTVDWGVGHTQ